MLSQITNILLTVQYSEELAILSRATGQIVEKELVIVADTELVTSVVTYRRLVLELFQPQSRGKTSYRYAVVTCLAAVLNGDWRSGAPEHRCRGPSCCKSRQHCIIKVQTAIHALLRATRPACLCRGNWLEWGRRFAFFTLAFIHQILGKGFQLAFGQHPQDDSKGLGSELVGESDLSWGLWCWTVVWTRGRGKLLALKLLLSIKAVVFVVTLLLSSSRAHSGHKWQFCQKAFRWGGGAFTLVLGWRGGASSGGV